MMRRLMVHMGVADKQASSALARQGKAQPRSQFYKSGDEVSLKISEGISRAWRLTGVALDRVGFAVEDRDRANGLYFVRYYDPMRDDEKGMLSRLAFWKDDADIDKEARYQVALQAEEDGTRVIVMDEKGTRDNSETAQRILTLLHEQIR
jgi:outer membrane protein assembly factor BamC